MKVAFLTTRCEKPSYRFRVQQFLPFLREHGITCDSFIIPASPLRRWVLFSGLRAYDVAFVQKKTFNPLDRMMLRAAARRLVYDVDDAIMYHSRGDRAAISARLRRRFRGMVAISHVVLAGNDFLCRQAANYTRRAICFRTVVDTDFYTPRPDHSPRARIVVGWSG
ncbi:MAG: hypothetical protein NT045_09290, partial [Candidatus Aureabacteria bacterium]|nr:hypothetical protein [Candidatus Auribacterota bacterium]